MDFWKLPFMQCVTKGTKTARLIWITPTDRLSARIKVQTALGASSLEQMRLGHASIKQHCEIQCEALEFSDEHKWLCDSN